MAAPPAKAQGEADLNDCDCHPNDPTAPICLLQNIRPNACSKSDATSEDCMWCSQFEGVACEGNYVEDFWTPHADSAHYVHRCKLLDDETTCVVNPELMVCDAAKVAATPEADTPEDKNMVKVDVRGSESNIVGGQDATVEFLNAHQGDIMRWVPFYQQTCRGASSMAAETYGGQLDGRSRSTLKMPSAPLKYALCHAKLQAERVGRDGSWHPIDQDFDFLPAVTARVVHQSPFPPPPPPSPPTPPPPNPQPPPTSPPSPSPPPPEPSPAPAAPPTPPVPPPPSPSPTPPPSPSPVPLPPPLVVANPAALSLSDDSTAGSVFDSPSSTSTTTNPAFAAAAAKHSTGMSKRTIMLIVGLAFGACALALFGALQIGAFGDRDASGGKGGSGRKRTARRDRKGAVRVAASDPDDEDDDIIGDDDDEEEEVPRRRRGRRSRRADKYEEEEEDPFDGSLQPAEDDDDEGEEGEEGDDDDDEDEAGAAARAPSMPAEPDEFDLELERQEAGGRRPSRKGDAGNPWDEAPQKKKKRKKKREEGTRRY